MEKIWMWNIQIRIECVKHARLLFVKYFHIIFEIEGLGRKYLVEN